MYLKEVIIDGFKSYATRTVVPGFDPSFNAITGLNGSGKSNVLDSICFVLGISNLSQVRASSLQELVYKGGQAGVTKATVTLVFNNEEKSTSPVGYEAFPEITVTRQIVVGGRNKYLINGHVAPPARVQNLFHLVGLNVNNPHFLIMQGRITRVIGMKPPELLSMVEEAAGTKMYENKKVAALKTIEKKAKKVDEINSLLMEKINPSLEKLEKERQHFMEWNQNKKDLEHHERYAIAYQYYSALQSLQKTSGGRDELIGEIEAFATRVEQVTEEKSEVNRELKKLTKERAALTNNTDIDKLEADFEALDKKITRTKGLLNNQREALRTEEATLEGLAKSIDEAEKSTVVKQAEHEEGSSRLTAAEEAETAAAQAVESAETAMLTGASQGGQAAAGTGSLIDQLDAYKLAASGAKAEIDSFKLRVTHLTAQYKDKSAKLSRDRAGVRAMEAEKKKMEKAISDAKIAVHELDFDEEAARALSAKLTEEKCAAAKLRERVDQLSARLGAYEFRYQDPKPGFDRRKVYGTIAKLARVTDESKATALEVTAGGRLYQVVVDSDSTANDLLKRGSLVRRVTILPLNKIRHDVLGQRQLSRAKELEPRTELALHLVGYDSEVSNAMEHVFGRTLICPDMDGAKKVTFDKGVRTRSVTLDGDVYDPSGTLSGGSSNRGGGSSVLMLLAELADAETELSTRTKNVKRLISQEDQLNAKAKQYRQLCCALNVQRHEEGLLAQRLSTSATGRLLSEVDALKVELSETIPAEMKAAEAVFAENTAKITTLESEVANMDESRDRIRAEAETAMKVIKDAHAAAIAVAQKEKDNRDSLVVEMEALAEEIAGHMQQRADVVEPSIEKLSAEILNLENKMARDETKFGEIKNRLHVEKEEMANSDDAIGNVQRQVEELSETIESSSLEKDKLSSKLRDIERGRSDAERLVNKLKTGNDWILEDSQSFGNADGEYDFGEEKAKSILGGLAQLRERQRSLSKKINSKAMHMFETAKDEYNGLVEKKRIIEQDKEKIEDVINGLDAKKMVALERTWKDVNRSFGEIFSELLPGTTAKLEPQAGKTVEEGLEIRVAFGEVWKDSLSELSGGQRSLIALSLVLAMLRFKPAPMYILDEVDAALDLNHTQNIGHMLRKHFSGSQFIVVSLKEGMFNNANVIFRTRFVDGVSTISKTVNDASRMDAARKRGSVEESARRRDAHALAGKENDNEVGRKRRLRT